MKNLKSFAELSKEIEVLSEGQQGKLRGGFAVFGSSIDDEEDSGTVNNCRCKNKNRRDCSGCSSK